MGSLILDHPPMLWIHKSGSLKLSNQVNIIFKTEEEAMRAYRNEQKWRILAGGLAMFIVVFWLFPFAGNAQEHWVVFKDGAVPSSPATNLVSSTSDEIVVRFEIPGMNSRDIAEENQAYQKLVIPNGGHTAEVGNPELPTVGRFVEIPYGVMLRISVVSSKAIVIDNYNVYPAQEALPDQGIDRGAVEFKKNTETYSTDSFYPRQIVVVDKPNFLRGHRIVLVVVYPVQYNPVSGRLKAYSEITVRIEFEGSPFMGTNKDDRFFQALLQRLVLNYEPAGNSGGGTGQLLKTTDFSSGGADYLIITHDNFYDKILSLAEWRSKKGLKTRIAKKTDVINAGYTWTADNTWDSNYTGIDGYIKNAYDNWNPAPSYVLLIGDADYLPTHYVNPHPDTDIELGKEIGSDLYYGCMDDANDLSYVPFPDIFVGRLPAKTSNDVDLIVSKIINYETSPYMSSTTWFDTVLLSAFFQDLDLNGYEDRFFVYTSQESIRPFLESEDYTCTDVYSKTTGSTPQYYYNGASLPPGLSFDGTTSDIKNAINAGCFLVNYRDHGDSRNGPSGTMEGWVDPAFQNSDIPSLTNGSQLPVMFSVCCRSGWFDGETDLDTTDPSPIPDCLGESWLKTSNKGGVGFIGSTRISYSGYNDELDKGFYDAIWDNFDSGYSGSYVSSPTHHLGPVLDYGKFWMYDKYVLTSGAGYPWSPTTEITRTEFEEFLILGDPALEIWTAAPSTFTNVTVTVTSSGVTVNAGLPNVIITVCSYDFSTFHESRESASGTETFATSVRPLYVTVTKHNYIPYMGTAIGSSSAEATAFNNGRRLVRGNNGYYHLVYESGGDIYYQYSPDNGASWFGGVRLSAGNGNNKYPSIVWENGKIYTLWQKYTGGSSYTIYFRANLGSGWGTTVSLGSITCSSPNNPQPVLTRKEVRISGGIRKIRLVGCWKTNSGISHRYSENDGTSWSSAALLPSTGSSHKNASLSPGASFDWTFLDIYATYDNGSTILLNKYHTNLSNNTTAWGTPETVPGSSGTTASCSQITSDANEPQPHAYIVWQGIDPIIEAEGVYYQRKSGINGSWSAVQSYVKEFQKPSITNLLSGNLAMIWDDYSSIYKATYDYSSGTWSARQLVATGYSPNTSISFGIYNPPSAAKYIWTSGTSSPYNLNLSSETLQKPELLADKYHRRVTVADSTQALLTVDLGDIYFRTKDGAVIPLKFTAVNDTLLTLKGEEFWGYLDSEPYLVPSNAESLVMELGVYTQDSEKLRASPSSHLTIALQVVDAEDHDDLLQVGNEEVISASGRMIENKAAEISSWAKRKVYTRVLVCGLDAKAEGLAYILTHVYDGHALSQFEKEGPGAQTSTGVPKVLDLTQNYPNPFNPETNITYALPQAINVRIEIYNILGQKIVTLFDAEMPAGNHSVRWNGRNALGEKVGAGIYLCRMQAGEFVKTMKMTLLP